MKEPPVMAAQEMILTQVIATIKLYMSLQIFYLSYMFKLIYIRSPFLTLYNCSYGCHYVNFTSTQQTQLCRFFIFWENWLLLHISGFHSILNINSINSLDHMDILVWSKQSNCKKWQQSLWRGVHSLSQLKRVKSKGDSFFSNIPFSISSKSTLWRIVANKNGLLRDHIAIRRVFEKCTPHCAKVKWSEK